mgnify:CR=1 FL=1
MSVVNNFCNLCLDVDKINLGIEIKIKLTLDNLVWTTLCISRNHGVLYDKQNDKYILIGYWLLFQDIENFNVYSGKKEIIFILDNFEKRKQLIKYLPKIYKESHVLFEIDLSLGKESLIKASNKIDNLFLLG